MFNEFSVFHAHSKGTKQDVTNWINKHSLLSYSRCEGLVSLQVNYYQDIRAEKQHCAPAALQDTPDHVELLMYIDLGELSKLSDHGEQSDLKG